VLSGAFLVYAREHEEKRQKTPDDEKKQEEKTYGSDIAVATAGPLPLGPLLHELQVKKLTELLRIVLG
jgi:hypothetical protein